MKIKHIVTSILILALLMGALQVPVWGATDKLLDPTINSEVVITLAEIGKLDALQSSTVVNPGRITNNGAMQLVAGDVLTLSRTTGTALENNKTITATDATISTTGSSGTVLVNNGTMTLNGCLLTTVGSTGDVIVNHGTIVLREASTLELAANVKIYNYGTISITGVGSQITAASGAYIHNYGTIGGTSGGKIVGDGGSRYRNYYYGGSSLGAIGSAVDVVGIEEQPLGIVSPLTGAITVAANKTLLIEDDLLMENNAKITVANNASVEVCTGATVTAKTGRSIVNNGSFTIQTAGDVVLEDGALLQNGATGVLTVETGSTLWVDSGATVTNAGGILVVGTVELDGTLTNQANASLTVDGNLWVNGGGKLDNLVSTNAAATLVVNGNLTVNSGGRLNNYTTISGSGTVSGEVYEYLTNDTKRGEVTANTGSMTEIFKFASNINGTITIPAGSTALIEAGESVTAATGTVITNNGTIVVEGAMSLAGNAKIINNAQINVDGTLTVASAALIQNEATGTIAVDGTLMLNGAATGRNIENLGRMIGSGLVNGNGRIYSYCTSGNPTEVAGSLKIGAGDAQRSTRVVLRLPATTTGSDLVIPAGMTAVVDSTVAITNGDILVHGALNIANGGVIQLNGAANVVVSHNSGVSGTGQITLNGSNTYVKNHLGTVAKTVKIGANDSLRATRLLNIIPDGYSSNLTIYHGEVYYVDGTTNFHGNIENHGTLHVLSGGTLMMSSGGVIHNHSLITGDGAGGSRISGSGMIRNYSGINILGVIDTGGVTVSVTVTDGELAPYALDVSAYSAAISNGLITLTSTDGSESFRVVCPEEVSISGATTKNKVTIQNTGTEAKPLKVTLRPGLSIDVSGVTNTSALAVTGNSVVDVAVAGNASLRGGSKGAGLGVDPNATLNLNPSGQTTGILSVTGGQGASGMGGTSGTAATAGKINLYDGTLYAVGGAGASGISASALFVSENAELSAFSDNTSKPAISTGTGHLTSDSTATVLQVNYTTSEAGTTLLTSYYSGATAYQVSSPSEYQSVAMTVSPERYFIYRNKTAQASTNDKSFIFSPVSANLNAYTVAEHKSPYSISSTTTSSSRSSSFYRPSSFSSSRSSSISSRSSSTSLRAGSSTSRSGSSSYTYDPNKPNPTTGSIGLISAGVGLIVMAGFVLAGSAMKKRKYEDEE